MTGSNVMNVISTRLFIDLKNEGKISLEPNTGSYFIGIFTFLGTIASIGFLNYFGRKTVLLWGNIVMSILLLLSGLGIIYDYGEVTIVLLMIYMFVFEST